MKKFLSTVLLSLLFAVAADAANRELFDEGWLFVLADSSQMVFGADLLCLTTGR